MKPNSPLFVSDAVSLARFAADVRAGLGGPAPKKLYPKYFYDELGSALFEAITFLPEYGLTRADARLLQRHARDLAGMANRTSVIAELGSGTGSKTRLVLQAIHNPEDVIYCPIDISPSAQAKCEMSIGQ